MYKNKSLKINGHINLYVNTLLLYNAQESFFRNQDSMSSLLELILTNKGVRYWNKDGEETFVQLVV